MTIVSKDEAPGSARASQRRPGRPKAEDVALIEARLIDEAAQLFSEKGYGHTTMSAVAAAARVSKTTLYSRFPAKGDLFRAMVERQMKEWGNGARNTAIAPEASLEDLLLIYGDISLRAGTSPDFIQLNRLLYSESGRFPELGVIARDRMNVGVGYLAEEIRRRAERDGATVQNPANMARFYLTLLAGWTSNAILSDTLPSVRDREDWLREAVGVLMRSLDIW